MNGASAGGGSDLQARFNVLSVERDRLARRYPGLSDGNPLPGRVVPLEAGREWHRLNVELERLEAQLKGPGG